MMEQALLEENQEIMINIILKEETINETQEQIQIQQQILLILEEELNLLEEAINPERL